MALVLLKPTASPPRPAPAAKVFAWASCEADDQFDELYDGRSYCYDENKTWAENVANGLPERCRKLPPSERCWAPEDKWVTFLNHKLASPLGVAAGPLLSSDWVALAASRGFDCLTYKTIRSHYNAGHGLPNIVHLQVDKQLPACGPACQEVLFARNGIPPLDCKSKSKSSSSCCNGGSSTNPQTCKPGAPEDSLAIRTTSSGDDHADGIDAVRAAAAAAGDDDDDGSGVVPLAITNSFGMPSLGPEQLLADIPRAMAALSPGQMMVVSITGTSDRPGLSFSEDLVQAARTALAGGATALEVNLSCPNVGTSHVALYQDVPAVEAILKELVQDVGLDVPLVIKVGSFPDADLLRRLMCAAERAGAGAVAGINGLSRRVELPGGRGPALGPERPTSGVCGDPIRGAGLEFIRQARQVIASDHLSLGLIGVGGVTQACHVMEYLQAGANVVQTATGFMWRPDLGSDFQRLWAAAGYSVAAGVSDGRGGRV